MAGWITAAAMSNTDLFSGPFFWVLAYLLVVGVGLVMWGAVSTPVQGGRTRAVWGVEFGELSLGVAALGLFWALVCNQQSGSPPPSRSPILVLASALEGHPDRPLRR